MRVWIILMAALVMPATAQVADEAEAVTLEQAITIALARHPDVEAARAAADGLDGRIREVRAQALPKVDLFADATRSRDPSLLNASGLDKFPEELRNALVPEPVNLYDYGVTVRQPIYTAGRVGTALRLASVESEGALTDIDRAEQDLALEVVNAFYGLIWAERSRDQVLETQEQRRLHAEMARTRFENGVATEVDVLRSEVTVANGRPEVVRAENAIRQARSLLNYYLVRPVDYPTQAVGEFQQAEWDEWDLEAIMQDAERRRPELLRLRIAEQSAATQLDLARAENRMSVDFNAAYGLVAREPKNLVDRLYARWNLGLSFTLPVFDGYERSGLVWQATANQRAARLEREKVEQQVRLGLQQGLDEIRAAQETIAAARSNIEQAERVLEMTQSNYQFGAATTLDIVDAQTALSEARTNLLLGLHDYSVARANLLWTAGRAPWQ